MTDSTVATPEETPGYLAPYQGESWAKLTESAITVFGSDLESGAKLVSVPFTVLRVTFREGDYELTADTTFLKKGDKGSYVYTDVVVAPEEYILPRLSRGRIKVNGAGITDMNELPVLPGEFLGFNESGPGVYRQIVQSLIKAGAAELPPGPVEGEFGESVLDIPHTEWTRGSEQAANGIDIRIFCPRGLRVSTYKHPKFGDTETRYIG
jgi:hypothetical protein